MTITVNDKDAGVEVNIGQSEIDPKKCNVTIYGPTTESVQQVIFDLADEYGRAEFTMPVRCADGKWGVMGRVWNHDP